MDEDITKVDEQPFICEAIQWTNCTGIEVTEYVIHSGAPPDGFARFRTGVTLSVDGKPAMQQMRAIPAETVDEAFVLVPQVIAEAEPEMLEEFKGHIQKHQQSQAKKIIVPSGASINNNGNRHQRRADASHRSRFNG